MTEPIADCLFSEDRVYRYNWARRVSDKPGRALGIFVNPSKADEYRSDNTITRWCNFVRRFGYGVAEVGNLHGFRATDPKDMKAASDPVGPDNDRYLREALQRCGLIVVGWGIHGAFMDRDQKVEKLIISSTNRQLYCFGKTKDGYPRHPSRLANNTELVRYS